MPLIDIFKRASRLVLNLQNSNAVTAYEEGEIVFCKNNVCVHPPTVLRQETEIIHHPGYLTISCQSTSKYCDSDSSNDTTLVLTWIPNATLRKCPSSVEKLSANKREQGSKLRASPKFDSSSPNRKNSVQSITSCDSHKSALSHSHSSELKDVFRCNNLVSSEIHLPNQCDGLSVGSNGETDPCSLPKYNDKYNLQVEMLDNDEVCRITMEETNLRSCDKSNSRKENLVSTSQLDDNSRRCYGKALETDESSVTLSDPERDPSPQNNSCANHIVGENPVTILNECNLKKFGTLESKANIHKQSLENGLEKVGEDLENCLPDPIEQIKLTNDMKAINISVTANDIVADTNRFEIEATDDENREGINDISKSSAIEERTDYFSNRISPESEEFLTSPEPIHKKVANPEFLGESGHSKDNWCTESSLKSCLRNDQEYEPDLSEGLSKNDASAKNSPSQLSSFSISTSSDTTNATSIDSTKISAEKEDDLPKSPSDCSDTNSFESSAPLWTYSSEYLNKRRYLPESNTASPATIRQIQRSCQKFSVDLGEMRSLRLFFSNGDTSSGQLVIASRESQYKILHFHHGGLDKLAKILQEWNRLTNFDPDNKNNLEDVPYRHFMICRPEVNENDLHPEEGKVPMLTEELWWNLLNEIGQIEDPLLLRKSVFFNGLPRQLRRTVWPFLLQIYSYQSTFADREAITKIRKLEYKEIIHRRSKLSGINKENFLRNVQYVVEKDVVRTDRNNPFYAGDMNPNLETMTNILLNYAVYDSSLGYLQGMSDLLAPLLAEIRDESETFWCFCGLMQRRLFVCTPTDADMEKNLRHLRELIRLMVPAFYSHLQKHEDAMELLFCHRWILLCFKREFPESVVFQIWEACWSNYLIDYFHLFVCLAIVAAYSPDVIAQDLRTDEMLLHFSSLSMYMDGVLILKKARWLLYRFRQLLVIPCSLATLCQFSGPGMWDNSHTPSVKCLDDPKYCPETPCPYRGSFAMDCTAPPH